MDMSKITDAFNQIFSASGSDKNAEPNTALKQALGTVATNKELRGAIWSNAHKVVKDNQILSKAHCEQIVTDYVHPDQNVKNAFAILFPSIALAFAKFLGNPGHPDLQVMMNGKLIDVYLKLNDGNLVVTNFTGDGSNKKEKTLLTLVSYFSWTEFANGAYKNPGTPAPGFQPQHPPGLKPQVNQPRAPAPLPVQGNQPWNPQPQVNQQQAHSPFAPVQGQPQPAQHYQPMHHQAHQPTLNGVAPSAPVSPPQLTSVSDLNNNPTFSGVDNYLTSFDSMVTLMKTMTVAQRKTWQVKMNTNFDNAQQELNQVPRATIGFSERSALVWAYQQHINDLMNAKQ